MLREYSREVDVSTLRALPVLKQAFALLSQDRQSSYEFVKYQLKAIRQDLTVQHIEDDFALEVYIFNALLSLRNKDIPEFAVCTKKVRSLDDPAGGNVQFLVFDMLLCLNYALERSDYSSLNLVLMQTGKTPPPAAALSAVCCFLSRNYSRFFKEIVRLNDITRTCVENIGLLDKMRNDIALKAIVAAYRPDIEKQFLLSQTGLGHIDCDGDYIKVETLKK